MAMSIVIFALILLLSIPSIRHSIIKKVIIEENSSGPVGVNEPMPVKENILDIFKVHHEVHVIIDVSADTHMHCKDFIISLPSPHLRHVHLVFLKKLSISVISIHEMMQTKKIVLLLSCAYSCIELVNGARILTGLKYLLQLRERCTVVDSCITLSSARLCTGEAYSEEPSLEHLIEPPKLILLSCHHLGHLRLKRLVHLEVPRVKV